MSDESLVEKVKTAAANLESALNEASNEGIVFKVLAIGGLQTTRGESVQSRTDWKVMVEAHRTKILA